MKRVLLLVVTATLSFGCPKSPCDLPNPPPECPGACKGCMRDGQCLDGKTVDACGVGGAACVACPSSSVCRRDATCGIDYDTVWAIGISTMSLVNVDASGNPLDPDGVPDTNSYIFCPSTSLVPYQTLQLSGLIVSPKGSEDHTVKCTATTEELLKLGIAFRVSEDSRYVTEKHILRFTEQQLQPGVISFGPFPPSLDSISFSLERR